MLICDNPVLFHVLHLPVVALCRSQWLSEASSAFTLPGQLASIADRVWVVQQCLTHTASDSATQQGLLQYGLQITAEHCSSSDLETCAQGELNRTHLAWKDI